MSRNLTLYEIYCKDGRYCSVEENFYHFIKAWPEELGRFLSSAPSTKLSVCTVAIYSSLTEEIML